MNELLRGLPRCTRTAAIVGGVLTWFMTPKQLRAPGTSHKRVRAVPAGKSEADGKAA